MIKTEYGLNPAASEDLKRILEYTTNEYSPEQALNYVYSLHAAFELLCESPKRGTVVEGQELIRYLCREEHVILYHLVSASLIEIIGVFHQSSNWVSHIRSR